MNLDNLKSVIELQAVRARAVRLMEAASTGHLQRFEVLYEGVCLDVMGVVSRDQIRQAIIESCDDLIRTTDKSLNSLGVATPALVVQNDTIEGWKRTAEMYLRAWLRSIGGKVPSKAHLIDALVIATEEIKYKADRFSPAAVPKALHDARVKELIEDNNRHQQEARDARRALAEYRALSPSDRLAADVYRAVADVLNKHNAKEA